MPVDIEEVQRLVAKEDPVNPLSALTKLPLNASSLDKRSREETIMFFEEIDTRYPAGGPPEVIENAVKAANQSGIISRAVIRAKITAAEQSSGLKSTEPSPLKDPAPLERFLELLALQRGAYKWRAGTTPAFEQWLATSGTAIQPLPDDAELNCWEAVLAAAAQAGLVDRAELRAAYAQSDRTLAVFALLTKNGCTELSRPWAANTVNKGDIIMIQSPDGQKLHHVIAVVSENHENLEMAQAMSLWLNVGGGGFTKASIQALTVSDGAVLRYSRLTA